MPQDPSEELLPPNYQDFPDGSLLRVVFHNFLTYEHTSFIPTASLNMILGHNGSGKSSIICGICLACGGSPKTLGRSEKITEYIRHGCQEGYVEVVIADNVKGPQTVRLTIRVGKAPEYKLNNSHATQSDINDLRKHYNIQIDNPCAFLAQDKVKSFSEQSSIELLKNTEKAASDDLDQRHRSLMEQRKDSMTIEELCATSEKAKKHLEDTRTKIMPLVENYRKKMALESKLRLLEKKMACMEFQEADEEYAKEQKIADNALVEYRKVEAKIKASADEIEKLEERINKEARAIAGTGNSAREILANFQSKSDKHMAENMLADAKSKLDRVKKEAEIHIREVEKRRNAIEVAETKWKAALDDLNGYDEFMIENDRSESEFTAIERELNKEEEKIHHKKYELSSLERRRAGEGKASKDNRNERWNMLDQLSSDAGEAWDWYKKNQSKFKGEIYTPFMNMILKSPEAAKILENSIGMRDRSMFVCQYKEDELLINGKQPWRINTTVVTAENVYEDELNEEVRPDLKDLGFKYLASNCFEAPAPLKQYLCNVAGLNKIPVGSLDLRQMDNINKELERLRVSVYMANNMRFQLQRSKYANRTLNSQSEMRDATFWGQACFLKSMDVKKEKDDKAEEYERLKNEIECMKEELKEKRYDITKKRDALQKVRMEWRSKKSVESKWENFLKQEKMKLRNLERETFDIQKAEDDFANVEDHVLKKVQKAMAESVADHKACSEKFKEKARHNFIETLCKIKSIKLNSKAEDYRSEREDLRHVKEAAEDQLKTAFNRRKAAKNALKQECALEHLDVSKMDPTDKELYEKMTKLFKDSNVPTDKDELDQCITSEKTRLALVQNSGEDGSIEHEHQLQRINKELEEECTKYDKLIKNRETAHQELGDLISKWREEVEEMIEKINLNYIKFFEVLGCRGEVSLETPENCLDIEKYGIMIMVCFRKGENMKRLDNRVQSGGERSVATMLYLLALQQLCPVPFRCIDEINQGMDPTNERKVFDIMVGLWNGTSGTLTKTQYFLLSPKLLHGLDMRDNVNVVMVNSTLTADHGDRFDTLSKIRNTFATLGIQS
ncbi:Protein CBR-SMC-5 [Caenorhabditis briggsae]|uniref:Structural maintenance of chromosomes protein 5 n=2 Tax=Caenorhabditis briggsae TaxID=6238 RepID=A8WUM2_CAEBR|nr:Protein CBR-SMC-5 [Caenorhabditis briggsae]ULU07102.1 hypothetical protein L3Y34_018705 [Caenorhabditis briggsae]CAP24184.1 Protein CBR-SMC-5 [Caenorhabditis briggsae]